MAFEINLNLIQLLLPTVCFGIQISGLLLYIYISYIFRSKLYFGIAWLIVLALVFAGCESLILFIGGWMHNRPVALQLHRVEQLAGLYFLFILPISLRYIIDISKKWQTINTFVIFTGITVSAVITVCAFAIPDSFVSMTHPKSTWLSCASDYGRGMEGYLYFTRDIFLSIVFPYCLISFIIDIRKTKNNNFQIYPLIGLFLAFLGASIDSIFVYTRKYFDFFPDTNFSRASAGATIGFLFFVFCITKKFISTTRDLEKANKIINKSEEKYRFLSEGTEECIFSMDMDFKITKFNKSAYRQLCVADKPGKTDFFDLLFVSHDEAGFNTQFAREKLEALLYDGRSTDFKVFFKSRGTKEPREYHVKFEMIRNDEGDEIIVKAASVLEDVIMKYLDRENMQLMINNYLIAAEEISDRLVQNLAKYLSHSNVNNVKIGLREIIINAIEHGNLNVTFEEKSRVNYEGNYIELILGRQINPAYRNKKVYINYTLEKDYVEYIVRDEGNGFDYKKIIEYIKHTVDQDMLEHGRGLRMAFNIFDKVKFNRKGNVVTLVKYF